MWFTTLRVIFKVGVKSMQHLDPLLMELKESVLRKSNECFSQGGYGVLRYQGMLCVPDVDDLRGQILEEGSWFSIFYSFGGHQNVS